jgi:SAM-dependent methyltransferase
MPQPDARVFLGMPGYGELTAGAARSFWRATKLPDRQVHHQYNEGSLLAANFNTLWVSALNLGLKDWSVDYFAMQHADVEPADWWLDTLIDEMESNDLDLLGVVVPIKDPKGLTSIALDRPDRDTWRPLCRLTMTDVHRLPPTFTSADVGYPILLNTGLWVCRFDPAWASKVRFTINDRIVFNRATNSYMAQCEPEDWYFSRLCHELGLRVGCTRKVPLTHRGSFTFPNDRAWGESFDSAWIAASPLPESTPERFVMPDITGWLRWEEGRELARLARGKRVLEIGSYYGLSTVCLGRMAWSVVALDWWDGRGTAERRYTLDEFVRNIERFGLKGVVSWGTPDMLPGFDADFDLVFVDGAHDRASVESDIERVLTLLAPGGLIAFHDYNSHADPGVAEAVDALISRGGEMVCLTESLAVVDPAALTLEAING